MGRGKRREVSPSHRSPRASIFPSPQPPHDGKRPLYSDERDTIRPFSNDWNSYLATSHWDPGINIHFFCLIPLSLGTKYELVIGHFPVLKILTFKTRLRAKPFFLFFLHQKKQFIFISKALKKRLEATWKWPICDADWMILWNWCGKY